MYYKEFASNLMQLMGERRMTLEQLSLSTGLSRRFLSNVINCRQVPTLISVEKICSALEKEPNELLMNQKSRRGERAKAMKVNTSYCQRKDNIFSYIPVCPRCNSLLPSDWQSYCDFCGQRLNWQHYLDSEVTMKKPQRKHLRDDEI